MKSILLGILHTVKWFFMASLMVMAFQYGMANIVLYNMSSEIADNISTDNYITQTELNAIVDKYSSRGLFGSNATHVYMNVKAPVNRPIYRVETLSNKTHMYGLGDEDDYAKKTNSKLIVPDGYDPKNNMDQMYDFIHNKQGANRDDLLYVQVESKIHFILLGQNISADVGIGSSSTATASYYYRTAR